jgi:hypothetical protein
MRPIMWPNSARNGQSMYVHVIFFFFSSLPMIAAADSMSDVAMDRPLDIFSLAQGPVPTTGRVIT